jgi:hypothetical protein
VVARVGLPGGNNLLEVFQSTFGASLWIEVVMFLKLSGARAKVYFSPIERKIYDF